MAKSNKSSKKNNLAQRSPEKRTQVKNNKSNSGPLKNSLAKSTLKAASKKTNAKTGIKAVAKGNAKASAKGLVKTAAKSGAKTTAKSSAKTTAKSSAKISPKTSSLASSSKGSSKKVRASGKAMTPQKPSAKKSQQAKAAKSLSKSGPKSAGKLANNKGVGLLTKSRTGQAAMKAIHWPDFFTPLDDRVVVATASPETTSPGGLILPATITSEPTRGKVLTVGPGRRDKKGRLRPMDLQPGDDVLFGEYAGVKITLNDTAVLLLTEEDVLGVLL